jgi:oxidoreductase
MTRALILGSTGAVGKALALELSHHASYTEVKALVRGDQTVQEYYRSLPGAEGASAPSCLHVAKLDTSSEERIREHAAQLQGYDDIYISLGTTRAAAGSAQRFLEVDQELPVLLAQLAVQDAQEKQHILYVSSKGANASSWLLYPRSKGQTEERLNALKNANTQVTIFRPGFLEVVEARPGTRLAESLVGPVIKSFRSIGVRSASAGVGEVARAMRKVAAGQGKARSVLDNSTILQLASE